MENLDASHSGAKGPKGLKFGYSQATRNIGINILLIVVQKWGKPLMNFVVITNGKQGCVFSVVLLNLTAH